MSNIILCFHYPRPVPLETPVIVEGAIDKVEGKKYYINLAMRNPDETKIYNTAKTLFQHITLEQFGVKSQM